jgi:hypothetical protein
VRCNLTRKALSQVEHDLIVLPELLDKPAGPLITRPCGIPQDLVDRAVAVDCGEDSLLCRIDRKGKVGVCVGPVDIERALSPHHRRPGWTSIETLIQDTRPS